MRKICLVVLLGLLSTNLNAQLCQGSLGDPIVNITFGAGPNPGPPLTFTSNLGYVPTDCPADGFYTVSNSTSSCFGNTWHSIRDHTGDANGYFMLINASLQRSEFYIDTVKGLCPGTTYEFAAWVINVNTLATCNGQSIRPNLTFRIEKPDGTLLQSFNTGDIQPNSSPVWLQSGFFFTTPDDAATVVLRIANDADGGCGNDLALDDITFRPCGPLLTPSVGNTGSTSVNLCKGIDTSIVFNCSTSPGFNDPSYQWQQSDDNGVTWIDIAGENSLSFTQSFPGSTDVGTYLFRMAASERTNRTLVGCKIASKPVSVTINPLPDVTTVNNNPVCTGSAIALSAAGGVTYAWTGPNNFTSSSNVISIPNASLAYNGTFTVVARSAGGCVNTASSTVQVVSSPSIAVVPPAPTICTGETVSLTVNGADSYAWSPATGLSATDGATVVASPDTTRTYQVVGKGANACTDTALATILVLPSPAVDAGPAQVLAEGQTVILAGTSNSGNIRYAWTPTTGLDNASVLQPKASPTSTTLYTLNAFSNNGCGTASDTVRVTVYKSVIIPNAFSPNGDGINDTWVLTALTSYSNYRLSVYNRYGQLVYSSANYSQPWDGTFNGKPLPIGTYYYVLDLKKLVPDRTGSVTIIR